MRLVLDKQRSVASIPEISLRGKLENPLLATQHFNIF